MTVVGETVTVRMSRGDGNTPWGFRLQGGQEYGGPLVIGKVAEGSLADRAGLREGDLVSQLVGNNCSNMKHKDAQDVIVSSGNNLDLIVQRVATGSGGAAIWKPAITSVTDSAPISSTSTVLVSSAPQAVISQPPVKVSLEHKKTETHFSGHNVAAKPFATQMGGQSRLTHQHYNSPAALYSQRNAADEYLHQQGGLFGTEPSLNKPKEEPAFLRSGALALIQDMESEGRGQAARSPRRSPVPGHYPHGPHSHLDEEAYGEGRAETLHHTAADTQSGSFKRLTHALHSEDPELFSSSPPSTPMSSLSVTSPSKSPGSKSPTSPTGVFFPMSPTSPTAPKGFHNGDGQSSPGVPNGTVEDHPDGGEHRDYGGSHHEDGAGGPPACDGCGRHIAGVFCKAGGKSLHADCFKCATCGSSLKNTGYFLVNNKLYCEIHARQHQQNQFTARPPQDPGTFMPRAPMPEQPKMATDPVKAFYQPEILKPGPVRSVSPAAPWKSHASPISPSARGVPGQPRMYASTGLSEELNTFSAVNSAAAQHTAPVVPVAAPPPPPATAPPPSSALYTPTAPPPPPPVSRDGGLGSKWTPSTDTGGKPPGSTQPRRGKGILKQMHEVPRIPVCEHCKREIRGPFVLAMGKSWCPDHFVCSNGQCHRKLLDVGFIEENDQIYCEYCFEQYFAPSCAKCFKSVTGDCLNALNRQWHPECFTCAHCNRAFGNTSFFLEDGKPYCEADWNSLFTTKCIACKFPIEAGDRWVEALNSAYHSDCFTCTMCHKNLEGQSFYAKGGRPYCKAHA